MPRRRKGGARRHHAATWAVLTLPACRPDTSDPPSENRSCKRWGRSARPAAALVSPAKANYSDGGLMLTSSPSASVRDELTPAGGCQVRETRTMSCRGETHPLAFSFKLRTLVLTADPFALLPCLRQLFWPIEGPFPGWFLLVCIELHTDRHGRLDGAVARPPAKRPDVGGGGQRIRFHRHDCQQSSRQWGDRRQICRRP